jgi:molybdenum cofactor guanylyltransferase
MAAPKDSNRGHQKHSAIARAAYGQFAREEWAIIGAPCSSIQQLSFTLIEKLATEFQIAYVDADHPAADAENEHGRDLHSAMAHGAGMEYIDKISYHRIDFEGKQSSYQYRQWFNGQDAVLVNGNHFTALRQLVIIDPRKETSLQKKLDRLTQVDAIILTDEQTAPYDFLQKHLEGQNIPIFSITDIDGIAGLIRTGINQRRAPLYGLVLAGGRSVRMGQDKGLINYHGKAQRAFMADLLKNWCAHTFISCRPDQVEEIKGEYPVIADTFMDLGPFGAILSAFRAHPDAAWLVVACDLPNLDAAAIDYLVQQRNASKIATTFRSPFDQFPEPLVTIWEPRSYPVLLQFLAQGYSCPRKALINSPTEILEPLRPESLVNVNQPEELAQVIAKLTSTN